MVAAAGNVAELELDFISVTLRATVSESWLIHGVIFTLREMLRVMLYRMSQQCRILWPIRAQKKHYPQFDVYVVCIYIVSILLSHKTMVSALKVKSVLLLMLRAAFYVAEESYPGVAVSSTTVAHKFRLWIELYILLPRFPLFSLLLQPEGSHPLATLDTTIDGVAPAVAISSKRFPIAHVNACKL